MKRFVSYLSTLLFCMSVMAHSQRPRVIVMTDGEVDDRCSMVRFLLYTNEMDGAAIIQTNSCFQPKGWSCENWLDKQIAAYEQILPNLSVHASGYPSADYLRSICYVGDEDPWRYCWRMTLVPYIFRHGEGEIRQPRPSRS